MSRSILFLGSQMAIAGAQYLLLHQAQWFFMHGYRVTCAFLYDKEGLEQIWQKEYPFTIINLHFRDAKASRTRNALIMISGGFRAWKFMRRQRFDAIETFGHHGNLLVVLAWLAGIPVRLASHHGRILGFNSWLERLHASVVNLGFASRLAAVSQGALNQALREGIHPQKIAVIPNGIEPITLERFNRVSYRKNLGISDVQRMIITVGRLTFPKAHGDLIEAASLVLKTNGNVQFLIAGDGPLRPALEKEARNLGIEKNIRLLGIRSDIPQLLASADLFVLPSLWEGLPIALLESLGAGLPTIATAIEGIVEVIEHKKNGWLVPPGDPQALAEAVCILLNDDRLRMQLGQNGQQTIHTVYTLEKMCRSYQGLLDPPG